MTSLKFLDSLDPSTGANYRGTYRTFLVTVTGCEKKAVWKDQLEEKLDQYFAQKRDCQSDVEQFFAAIRNRAPLGVSVSISKVKTLLSENGVELPARFWKSVYRRIKGNQARTMDRIPSNQELKSVLMNMSIQGRALFSLLASSGMRIGEALQLRVNDLDLGKNPVQVSIRGEYTKSGNPRTSFASLETKEFLEKWLPQRGAYIASSSNLALSLKKAKDATDSRVFPFSATVGREMWTNAVRKAGLYAEDPTTKRTTLHPHVLRKFFRTRMGAINVDLTEAMMGHEGYLTSAYRRYTIEDQARFYKDNEHVLAAFSDQTQIAKLKTDLDEKDKLVGSAFIRMQNEISEHKTRLDHSERFHKKFLGLNEEELDKLADLIRDRLEQRFVEKSVSD